MSEFALHVAAGDAGTDHAVTSPKFTDFAVGQALFLSYFLEAVRVSGTDNLTVQSKIHWYNSSNAEIGVTTDTIPVNGSVNSLREFTHFPQAGAVSGTLEFVVTPTASPMQHNVWIRKARLGKTQRGATYGATWGVNVTGNNMPADNATRNADGANMIPSPVQLDQAAFSNGAYLSDATSLGTGRPLLYGKRAVMPMDSGVPTFYPEGNHTAIPCTPGETLYWSYAAAKSGTLTTDRIVSMFDFYGANGSFVGTVTADVVSGNVVAAAGILTWTGTAIVPADAAYVRPRVKRDLNTESGYFMVGEVYLGRQQPGATDGATWGVNIGGNNMPADNAGTTVTPKVVDGTHTISGNNVTKTSVSAWDTAVYVLEPMIGTAFVQFRGSSSGGIWMAGLSDDPTVGGTNSYSTIDYGFYRTGNGDVRHAVHPGGYGTVHTGAVNDDTIYTIIYDGTRVFLYYGSTLLQSFTTTAGRTFYFKICAHGQNSWHKDIKCGTFAAAEWGGNVLGLPNNLAALTGSEGINNSNVSIGSNGALVGAGGGQVTFPGIAPVNLASFTGSERIFNEGGATNQLFNGSLRLSDGNGGALGWTRDAGSWDLISSGDGFQLRSLATGTKVASSDPITVNANQTFTLELDLYAGTMSAGALNADVIWYSDLAATQVLLDDGGVQATNGEGWKRFVRSDYIAPAGAVRARVRVFTVSATPGAAGARARNIKFSRGVGATTFSDEATNSAALLTTPGTGRRLPDGRAQTTNRNFGLRATNDPPALSAADAGTTATISIGASTWYPDWGGSITFPSGSIPGLAFSTKYFIWRNQADPTTAGESYAVSTILNDALGTGKVYLGYCTTPVNGGDSTGGTIGGGMDCVHPDAWVELEDGSFKRAADIVAGDRIVVLDYETFEGTRTVEVESNHLGENETVTLTTASGIKLTLSLNTPITLRDGTWTIAANAWKHELPVKDENGFRWERCVNVEYAGKQRVAHVKCHACTYAAGNEKGRSILTHNPSVKV